MSSLPIRPGQLHCEFQDWGFVSSDPGDGLIRTLASRRRLALALAQERSGCAPLGPVDLMVLTRSVLRATALAADDSEASSIVIPYRIADRVHAAEWESASVDILERTQAGLRMVARPWRPNWLPGAHLGGGPEAALYERSPRRPEEAVLGDPMLGLLGWSTYQTEAQREAVRTVTSAPLGSTIIVNLPTGAGKSLCALLPALLPASEAVEERGVTPIIVPTVALQLDLEAKCQDAVGHPTAYRPEHPTAREIALRTRDGVQGPVFLSPESLVGSFAGPLRKAAQKGLLRGFVLDEAHMVTSWGDDFRPAFQQIAAMRRELLELCRVKPFITILMSATLTPYNLDTLRDLFGGPGPVHHVHAVRLRPEPAYWITKVSGEPQRWGAILDALRHLPRPLILYTTKRVDAEAWYQRIRNTGISRCGLIHGGSKDDQRSDLLQRWSRDEIDVVVATSAFGLGVDKPDVRAIIHAALPESIDRFYQDVGRSGRDGWGSVSLLVWTERDEAPARSLGIPTFIGADRGLERWTSMFFAGTRQVLGNGLYVVPLDVSPTNRMHDIDMDGEENRLWNLRTILLLVRAGIVELATVGEAEGGDKVSTDWNRIALRIRDYGHLTPETWADKVAPRREQLLDASRRSWDLMQAALREHRCLSTVFSDAYKSRADHVMVVRACGGCPFCRAEQLPFRCGKMIARHSPREAWPPRKMGRKLHAFLKDAPVGLIFYAPGAELRGVPARLEEVVRWLCDQHVSNLVASTDLLPSWANLFARHPHWRVYLHQQLPTDITRNLPTAYVISGRPADEWRQLWMAVPRLPAQSILLLPENLAEPGRPDRLIRDIVVGPPCLTLNQWQELFLE